MTTASRFWETGQVLWTDAERKQHEVAGPKLEEGQQGTLTVTLTPVTAIWDAQLR